MPEKSVHRSSRSLRPKETFFFSFLFRIQAGIPNSLDYVNSGCWFSHPPEVLAGKRTIYFRIISLMSAMTLRSLNLPGVGTKYEIETEKGDTVAIFFTKTGTIQMYTLQKGCNTPSAAVMSPVEARRLGNILTGAIIEADKESVEIAFSALADLRVTIHTFNIPSGISGKTIEDLQIRAKTGATVIAVCRQDKNIINPPPSFVFEGGDAVLVIGESDQIKNFEREIMVE